MKYVPKNNYDCPICHGQMVLRLMYKDVLMDGQGELEGDLDGAPIWVEWAEYVCDQCEHTTQRIHRYLNDAEAGASK